MTRVISFGLGASLLLLLMAHLRVEESDPQPEEIAQMTVAVKPVPPAEVLPEDVPEPLPPESPQPEPETPDPVPEQAPPEVDEAPELSPADSQPSLAPAAVPAPNRLPSITAEYRQTLGFNGYTSAMIELGGRFFLYDDGRDKLLAEIDPQSGQVMPVEKSSLRGMSPRLRELSNEPEARALLGKHRGDFEAARLKLVLIVPQRIENAITQQLRDGYASGNIPNGEWMKLEGVYQRKGGRLVLRLDRALTAHGIASPIQLDIYL